MIPPSFQSSLSSSSSMTNDGMMAINASHPKIKKLLHPYIDDSTRAQYFARCCHEDELLLLDERLVDFGSRYHIIVKKVSKENNSIGSTDFIVLFHASVIGWDEVKDHAIPALQSIFGVTNVSDPKLEEHQEVVDVATSSEDVLYDVCIKVISNQIPKGQTLASCFDSLYKVRTIILGSRLIEELSTFLKKIESSPNQQVASETYTIPIQRHNKSNQSMVVTTTRSERVTIVIPVVFENDTERAFAKLFLQQFQQAQRKSSAKNAPICDFRRCNEPPREMASVQGSLNIDIDNLAGYMSFTFLENQFKTEKDHMKVTENMLMLFDFLDYHIKCSKSYLHTRMRDKKEALLSVLNKN